MNILSFLSAFFLSVTFAVGNADINSDGQVNQGDLAYIVNQWNTSGATPSADLNGDGIVNVTDAGILFSSWGAVPPPPDGSIVRLTSDRGIPCNTGANGPDVSASINSVINGVSAGATIQLECVYKIDLPVWFENKNGITLTGAGGSAGTGFIRYTQNTIPTNWTHGVPFYQYVVVRNSSNIRLDNYSIAGPLTAVAYDQARESAHGLLISGSSSNVTVNNLTIKGVHGDFLTVAEHGGTLPTNITIDNMTGDIAGRQMVAPTGVNGILIKNSRFTRAARSAIDVEPSNQLGAFNITIEDTYISGFTNYGLAGGGLAVPHYNLIVRRTTFKGGRGLAKWQNNASSTTPTHVGFRLEDVDYHYVSPEYAPVVGNSASTIDARDLYMIRTTMHFRGGGTGNILGTGEIRDSRFTADNSTTGIVYCVYGLTVTNTVGAAVGPSASCP